MSPIIVWPRVRWAALACKSARASSTSWDRSHAPLRRESHSRTATRKLAWRLARCVPMLVKNSYSQFESYLNSHVAYGRHFSFDVIIQYEPSHRRAIMD